MVVFPLILPTVAGTVLFLAAGRLDLPMVWAVLGVLTVFSVAIVVLCEPGLVRERVRPGPGNRDRFTSRLGTLLLAGHWIVTGLDVGRYQWSPVPLPLQIIGLLGYAAGLGALLWAMRVNPFYSSVVRIQTDRGHRPITTGPYRFVRHPGYTASIVCFFCGGLALGSWLGTALLAVFAAVFIRRTLLEDRLLMNELEGYADYARKVRYRLIPGLF
jgi:protein-S-isoprenylcysteine O-methyltransferase Ste14